MTYDTLRSRALCLAAALRVGHPPGDRIAIASENRTEYVELLFGAGHESLDAHCLERIARFKRPKRYVFVETLPKNSYGKVPKRELRLRLARDEEA